MGKAWREKQHFVSLDMPADGAQPGELIDIGIVGERGKKGRYIGAVRDAQKGGSLPVMRLAIALVQRRENLYWVGADTMSAIKRGSGHMPGPARLHGQCHSEFDIVKRLHDAHIPPIVHSTLPIVLAIGHNWVQICSGL